MALGRGRRRPDRLRLRRRLAAAVVHREPRRPGRRLDRRRRDVCRSRAVDRTGASERPVIKLLSSRVAWAAAACDRRRAARHRRASTRRQLGGGADLPPRQHHQVPRLRGPVDRRVRCADVGDAAKRGRRLGPRRLEQRSHRARGRRPLRTRRPPASIGHGHRRGALRHPARRHRCRRRGARVVFLAPARPASPTRTASRAARRHEAGEVAGAGQQQRGAARRGAIRAQLAVRPRSGTCGGRAERHRLRGIAVPL